MPGTAWQLDRLHGDLELGFNVVCPHTQLFAPFLQRSVAEVATES